VIVLSPEVQLICFVHSTMNATFPQDYSPQLCFFLPFPIFEILHYSQHTSRSAMNWTRKLVAATIQTKKTLLVGGGGGADDKAAVALAAVGAEDGEMHSIFGSEKTALQQSVVSDGSDEDGDLTGNTHEEASILDRKNHDDSSMNALYASQSVAGSPTGITPLNHINGGFTWEANRTASDGTMTYLPGQPEPQIEKIPPRRRESPSNSYAVQQSQDSRADLRKNNPAPRHVPRSRRASSNLPLSVPIKDTTVVETVPSAVSTSPPRAIISLPMPIGDRPALKSSILNEPAPDVVIHVHSRDPQVARKGAAAPSTDVSPESQPLTGLPEEVSEPNSQPHTPLPAELNSISSQ
jgi:hypothetical protein